MAEGKMIRVLFVDAASGAGLGRAEMPADQLPGSFEARTTLQLGGQDWEVVTADPMTRAGFERTGELRLTLRRITVHSVPAGDVLFSLPTICDEVPGIAPGTSKLGKRVLELHEDDWRQVELVACSHRQEIDACLAEIERVHAEARTPQGFFRRLHVRKEVAGPLEGCHLPLAMLSGYFPSLTPLEGLAYRDVAGLVGGGFGLESESGLRLYGVERGRVVTVLGLVVDHVGPGVGRDAPALVALMRAHDLCLIDWCSLRQLQGTEDKVVEYLMSWVVR
jgi:hypothetical protein